MTQHLPDFSSSSSGTFTATTPTDKPVPEETPFTAPLFRLSDLRGFTQHLTGRLKTLIDGATPDQVQRKALKDLIHAMTWEEHYGPMSAWAYKTMDERAAGVPFVSPPFSSTGNLPPEDRFA